MSEELSENSSSLKEITSFKEFKCHKVVSAFKIAGIEPSSEGDTSVNLLNDQGTVFSVPKEWIAKHGPVFGGYVVKYADGYLSFSPADAFESGYTEVPETSGEYTEQQFVKTMHNSDISGAKINVKDIKVFGNGDMFQLLCKASSENEGWMKSTKAMPIGGLGCVVQVTTQQRNPDGTYSIAEALTFVPGAKVADDEHGGRRLF